MKQYLKFKEELINTLQSLCHDKLPIKKTLAIKVAIQNINAWEHVIAELAERANNSSSMEEWKAYKTYIDIMKKHLNGVDVFNIN